MSIRKQMRTISIHTLTWRVILTRAYIQNCVNISIHTLTWRVIKSADTIRRFHAISIHTLTWRVIATFGISYSEI